MARLAGRGQRRAGVIRRRELEGVAVEHDVAVDLAQALVVDAIVYGCSAFSASTVRGPATACA